MAVGLAIVVAFGFRAEVAVAQSNQAQQMAYAKAYQGRWFVKGGNAEYDVKNDGKEVHFELANVSPQAQQMGFGLHEKLWTGTFDGPAFKGYSLLAIGGDDNGRARVRSRCGGHKFWVVGTGKMNFDRNELALAWPVFVLVRNPQTNKCETIMNTDKRYEQVRRSWEVVYNGTAANLTMVKKQQAR
jgi:hypothetical protein